MKRLMLSASLATIGVIAISAALPAFAQQRSSVSTGIHELVQYNRDVRDKN